MLKGIAAMPSLSMLLKSGALACATVFAATSAVAEDYTVYVYEKGFFPNKVYMQGIDRIKFVNKTSRTLGLDYSSGGIMINDVAAGNSVYVSPGSLWNRPLRSPYNFAINGYSSGKGFSISGGKPPNS